MYSVYEFMISIKKHNSTAFVNMLTVPRTCSPMVGSYALTSEIMCPIGFKKGFEWRKTFLVSMFLHMLVDTPRHWYRFECFSRRVFFFQSYALNKWAHKVCKVHFPDITYFLIFCTALHSTHRPGFAKCLMLKMQSQKCIITRCELTLRAFR